MRSTRNKVFSIPPTRKAPSQCVIGPQVVFPVPCSGSRPALGTAPLAPGFVATYGNDKGQFLLTIRDGHQILTAKDAKGKQIFQGSIDTPEQRKLVPEDVGKELEEMEKIKESVKEKVRSKVHEGVPGSYPESN